MKKKLFILGLAALLTACSGSVKMTEITEKEFYDQTYAGQDVYMTDCETAPVYKEIVIKGKVTNTEDGEKEVINVNVTYKQEDGEWKPNTEDEKALQYADTYRFYSGSMFVAGLELTEVSDKQLTYTAGKDCWAVKGSYKATLELDTMNLFGASTVDYKFNNKYGFATSIVSKAEQTATISGISKELVTEMNLKVSYK